MYRDRLGSGVSMELLVGQVCHQRGLVVMMIEGGGAIVLLNPGLQLGPVLCCDRWRQGWWS